MAMEAFMNMSFDMPPSSDMPPIVLEVIERAPRPHSPLTVEMFDREDTEVDDVGDEGDGDEAAPEGDDTEDNDTEDDEVDDDEIMRVLSQFDTTQKFLPTTSKAVPSKLWEGIFASCRTG